MKCPRCGRGELFRRWFMMREHCANCDLQFERSPGDTWGFWVIGDRIFIAAIVAGIFLGYRPTSRIEQALLAAAAIAALIWTMPHRQGICVALDYILQTWTGHEHPDNK